MNSFGYCLLICIGMYTSSLAWGTTSQPSSCPTSRPAAKHQPSSRPTSQPKISVQTQKQSKKPNQQRTEPMPTAPVYPLKAPKRTGWLSIALTQKERIWIDGHWAGTAPLTYMRVGAGKHTIRIRHKEKGVRQFNLLVPGNRHSSIGRQKNQKLGFYYVRGSESEVSIRIYPKTGGAQRIQRSPGPFCTQKGSKKRCVFLTPGEQYYVQADQSTLIVPSKRARLATRPFPSRSNMGKLTLYSYPPGALFVRLRLYALTPVSRLPLEPGSYAIRIHNGFLHLGYRGTVTIQAGRTTRKVVYLQPKKGGSLAITSTQPAQIFIQGLYRGWTPARVLPLKTGTYTIRLRYVGGHTKRFTVQIQKGKHSTLHVP